MSFRLTFAPTADKSFALLPRRVQEQFDQAFDLLERDPRRASTDPDVHQLYGYRNIWTLRVPPFRAIYAIDGRDVVLVVFGHRDTIYSTLHSLIPPRRQTVSKSALQQRR